MGKGNRPIFAATAAQVAEREQMLDEHSRKQESNEMTTEQMPGTTTETLFESERVRVTVFADRAAQIGSYAYAFDDTAETSGVAFYDISANINGEWMTDLQAAAPMYDETLRQQAVDLVVARASEINGSPIDLHVSGVFWIAMMGYESIVDVTVRERRVLVDAATLLKMAHDIEDCGLATAEEDAAYAADIRATQTIDGSLYDVTDFGGDMFRDGLMSDHGIVVDGEGALAPWTADDERSKHHLIAMLTPIEIAIEIAEEGNDVTTVERLGKVESTLVARLNALNVRHQRVHPQHDGDGFEGRCLIVEPDDATFAIAEARLESSND